MLERSRRGHVSRRTVPARWQSRPLRPARSERGGGGGTGHAVHPVGLSTCYRYLSVLFTCFARLAGAVPSCGQVGNPVQRDPSVCSEEEYKNFLLAYIDLRYLDYRHAAREGLRLRVNG
jgi:hypothetical protein